MTTEAKAGFVTLDEVRALVGETDPNQMSSPKMRELLGSRGSFGTIDKFLNVLRAERALALNPPTAPGTIPSVPTDIANQIWMAAYTAAQVVTMTRAEKLAAERDAALVKLDAQGQDLNALIETVDGLTEQLAQAAIDAEQANTRHQEFLINTANETVNQVKAVDALKAELATKEAKIAALEHDANLAAEMATLKLIHAKDAMQTTIDNLTSQIGDLKGLLYATKTPPVAD